MRPCAPILLLALLLAVPALGQPAVSVEPQRLDFGSLPQNTARKATVTIGNTGDELLHIRDVETSCGCTVVELAREDLQPGETVDLTVEFNSKQFMGPQTKYIHVFTNDPQRGAVDIVITADVQVHLYMNPPKRLVGFEVSKVGERPTRTWDFWTKDVPELELTAASYPEDWIALDIENGVDGDPQRSRVTFTLLGDKAGRYRDQARLRTNIPEEPSVTLELGARVVYELVLGRDRVAFRYVQPGQVLRTQIRVGAYGNETKFKLTGAEIDIPGLKAEVENTIIGEEGQVHLQGKALTKEDPLVQESGGRIQGTLKIFTDLPSTPVMEVPVSYMIRQ